MNTFYWTYDSTTISKQQVLSYLEISVSKCLVNEITTVIIAFFQQKKVSFPLWDD